MSAASFPLALAFHAAGVVLALALRRRPAACRAAAFLASAGGSLATLVLGASVLATGRAARGVLFTNPAAGVTVGYAVDPLSAWFLVTLAVLAAPVAVYSVGYLAHAIPPGRTAFVGVAWNALLLSVETVFAADGVLGFLLAWELMTLATAGLVATDHESRPSRRSAFLFLAMSHLGTGCLVAAFFLLASGSGSLAFADLLGGAAATASSRELLFVLFLLGFGVKAGVVPLHVWLPEAHPAAPSNVSALMSGGLVNAGLYGLVRVGAGGLGRPDPGWGMGVLLLGSVSAVLGVLYALSENDLKRLLAFSTIENGGIALMGFGAGMIGLAAGRPGLGALGFAAGLFHVLNHAAFKGLLFLGAGGVVAATGTRRLEELGGLVHRMPRTAGLFLLGSAAIAGLPLLNGFASEWLVFQSLLRGFFSAERLTRIVLPLGGALLALTSALAAACFVKAFALTFLALPRSRAAAEATEAKALLLAPQAFLAAACVALGLFPGLVVRVLAGVAASLPGIGREGAFTGGLAGVTVGVPAFDHLSPFVLVPAAVLGLGLAAALGLVSARATRRAPAWGCGGELSAQTEYTATAFAKPLVMVFRGIYRPTREVSTVETAPYFASEVRYRSEIGAPFERHVYGPATRAVLAAAERLRVIQAGSLHAYLAYVLVLGVILLWWLGGLP
ncbi:MAG TPA: proton-conducting transporter membrane subunit [Vicinamibacteria bacterium]